MDEGAHSGVRGDPENEAGNITKVSAASQFAMVKPRLLASGGRARGFSIQKTKALLLLAQESSANAEKSEKKTF